MSELARSLFLLVLTQLILCKTTAQIVVSYKSLVPAEVFNEFLHKEKNIADTLSVMAARIYLETGRKALVHNEDLAINYESRAKQIFRKLGVDSMVAVTNLSLSFPYINKGLYNHADTVIQEVMAYAQWRKDAKMTADAQLRMGYKEYVSGRPDNALAAFLNCFRYYRNKKQNQEYGDIIMRLGITYAAMGDCVSALQYWEEYVNAAKNRLANDKFIIPVKSNMMDCFQKTGNVTAAKIIAREVIQVRKNSNSFKLLCKSYLSLSFLSITEKDMQNAQLYVDTAYHYAMKFGNERLLSDVILARADLYMHSGKYTEAVSDLEKALLYAKSSNTPLNQIAAFHKLAAVYSKKGLFQKAYVYDQKGDSIKDAIFSADVLQSVKALEKQILQQNSDEKIALLETQNKLKNENILQQKKVHDTNVMLLILSGILLVLLTCLIIIRTRNNKLLTQKNKEIEKALALNKILVKEMHHRVKNNLQIVASLLGLQSRFAKNKNVSEAVTEGKTRVQAMSLLHQSLYKNEDLKTIPIKKYFVDLCDSLHSTFSLKEQNITLIADIQDLNLDLDQVVTLGMIANECILNSIKHAFVSRDNGIIALKITEKNKLLTCRIKDNGVGIQFLTIPDKSTTMGMQLISSFVKKLDGTIQIKNDEGTEIIITCKPLSLEA